SQAALEPGSAATIEASEGERLAGTPQATLAWRARWGGGSVTLLAADPTLEPLRNWSGSPLLLVRTLEPVLTVPQADAAVVPGGPRGTVRGVARLSVGQLLSGVLETLPPGAFPSADTVALLLGGFALLAGPLLHAALGRADRRPWLW